MNIVIFKPHVEVWGQKISSKLLWDAIFSNINLILIINNINELIEFINSNQNICLIPCIEDSMELLYKNNINLCKLPSYDLFLNFKDKLLFNNFAINNGLEEYIPKIYNDFDIKFPCVCKSRTLNNSNGIFLINNEFDYEKHKNNDNSFFQEYIEGELEYTSNIVVNNGIIIYIKTNEYILSSPINIYSNSTYRHNVKVESVDIFQKFLCNYNGFCNIDYKYDSQCKIKILEINPRMGGSSFKDDDILIELLKFYIF